MWDTAFVSQSGIPVKIDPNRDGHDTDVAKFERKYKVKPGDKYKIKDSNENFIADYVYLGSLWSLCICSGGSMYISPSNNPHWYTVDSAKIHPADIAAAIQYIATEFEPDLGYEMEA